MTQKNKLIRSVRVVLDIPIEKSANRDHELLYANVWFDVLTDGSLSIRLQDGSECCIAAGKWLWFFATDRHCED